MPWSAQNAALQALTQGPDAPHTQLLIADRNSSEPVLKYFSQQRSQGFCSAKHWLRSSAASFCGAASSAPASAIGSGEHEVYPLGQTPLVGSVPAFDSQIMEVLSPTALQHVVK